MNKLLDFAAHQIDAARAAHANGAYGAARANANNAINVLRTASLVYNPRGAALNRVDSLRCAAKTYT